MVLKATAMGKVLAAILGIFGLIVVFYLFPSMMNSLQDLRTDDQDDAFTYVATAAGVTNATVTLTKDLWQSDTTHVTTIASNNSGDTGAAQYYASNVLSVSGLAANSSRNLTVTYRIAALGEYEGMSELTGLAPLILFISFVGIILALIWKSFSSRRGQ